ncbi:MAG: sugar ABC transporter permease [Clostridia bacterium]|nr:sugar ABC transporter permease [Clostridia bacterium]
MLKKHRFGKLKNDFSAYILMFPAIFLIFLLIWRPVYQGFILSFFKLQGYEPAEFVGLQNYKDIISETLFKTTVFNTFKYVGLSLLVGFIPPIFIAVMLNEVRWCKGFIKFAIYFPAISPVIVTSLLWTFIYDPSAGGLLNMILLKMGLPAQQWLNDANHAILYIIISMTWSGFGSATILYLSSIKGIGTDMYEAAYIDGAGLWARVWHITIPQIWRIVLLMLVNNIIGVFQVFAQPLAMTGGGPNNATVSLSLLAYRYAFVYLKNEKALAIGMITFVMLVVLTVFYFFLEKRVTYED